jgi:hypothetical protein
MNSLENEVNDFFKRLAEQDNKHALLTARKAYTKWFDDYKQGRGELDRHLIGMNEHNLSCSEATLILSYTARTSSWTNQHAHYSLSQDNDLFRLEHNSLLSKILARIPLYSGKTVFRIDFNSPACYDEDSFYTWIEDKIGQVLHVPYFWSTSKERWDDNCLTWEIQTSSNSNARDISNLTQTPSEKEVIFISGTNFQVLSVDKEKHLVSVIEVDTEEYDIPLIGLYYKNYK